MISYKKLIEIHEAFADAHYKIKNFGNGERWQVVDHSQESFFKYPLMFVEDRPQRSTNKEWVYSFRIWFVTRVESPEVREDVLYSEYKIAKSMMVQCAQDLIAWWAKDTDYPFVQLDRSINIETFTDKEPDRLTGCYVDINYSVAFDYNKCILPMDNMPTPENPCQPVLIYEDGILVATVQSGGSYSYVSGGGSIDIDINGTLAYDDQASDVDIPVVNTATTPVGTWNGTSQVIGNSPITINGASTSFALAETTKAMLVRASNNTNVGSWNAIGQRWVVGDAVLNIKNSAGTDLYNESLLPESTQDRSINDSTVNVKDSAGNTLYAKTVLAEGTADQTVTDTQVSLNGSNLTANKAQTNKAMTIQRANGDPVTVTTVTDTETVFLGTVPNIVPVINSATIYKSGAITSTYTGDDGDTEIGDGTDWYNLDYLNFFGTNKRFTGTTGGYQSEIDSLYYDVDNVATTYALAFPNTIKIDWAYWNNGNGNVYMWYDTPFSSTGTNALANQPYTLGGFNDWRVPNIPQLRSLFRYEGIVTGLAMFQYPPFNYTSLATANRFWTCNPTITGALINFNGGESLTFNGVGTTCRVFAYRIGNTSEL